MECMLTLTLIRVDKLRVARTVAKTPYEESVQKSSILPVKYCKQIIYFASHSYLSSSTAFLFEWCIDIMWWEHRGA